MTPEEQKEKYKKMYVRERRTNKEIRAIYSFLRQTGMSREKARYMCQWTISHILQYIKSNTVNNGKQHILK